MAESVQQPAAGFFNPLMGQAPFGDFFGGGVGPQATMPWTYDAESKSFLRPYFVGGRRLLEVSSGNSGVESAGRYYVHVSHPASGGVSYALERKASEPSDDDANTYVFVAELASDGGSVAQSGGIYAVPTVFLYDW